VVKCSRDRHGSFSRVVSIGKMPLLRSGHGFVLVAAACCLEVAGAFYSAPTQALPTAASRVSVARCRPRLSMALAPPDKLPKVCART
jgi:hypothetical protein